MPIETAHEELIPVLEMRSTCLADIQPGERVTLITDRPSEEVGRKPGTRDRNARRRL